MRKGIKRKLLGVIASSSLFGATQLMAVDAKTQVLFDIKNVKVISQDLAKNYFYIEQKVQTSSAKSALKESIIKLDDSIRRLQLNIKDKEKKQIIEFMFFSVDELKSTLKKSFNAENGGLVLDYTEALYEGSSTIAKSLKKTNPKLDIITEMGFLLDRASKYYIAFRAGYTDSINISAAKDAVAKFDKLLSKIQNETYPSHILNGPIKKLIKYWPVSKNFYLGIKKNELPSIVFISTKHMKKALKKISKYYMEKN